MEPIRIGLLGLGTVGCGVLRVLRRNAEEIARRSGRVLQVTRAACREPDKPRDAPLENVSLHHDPSEVVEAEDVDVVVELIGGCDPSRRLVMRAIERGLPVATANKALIALHGNEIFAAARERGVAVAFEAAVAGGIPVIKVIREGLSSNRILRVAGIVNGTCNFVLTEMHDHDREFDDALAEAQRLGYAEANPSFDIDGIDAAHKLAIMGAAAFGAPLQFDRIHVEGISGIKRRDIAYADELGYKVKHLALASRADDGLELRAHPALLPAQRLLARVDGVMNAVEITGDAAGPTLYYGAGAGADATASAVVSDLVDIVRTLTLEAEFHVPHLAFQPEAVSDMRIAPIEEARTAYYLRLMVCNQTGVLAKVARLLADRDISIESVIQKGGDAAVVPLILLTHSVLERDMNKALEQIKQLPAVVEPPVRLRVEGTR